MTPKSVDFGEKPQNTVAVIHSHSNYDMNYVNEDFSEQDKKLSNNFEMPLYLTTPKGALKKFNPTNKVITTIISVGLPYDSQKYSRRR